MISVWSTMHKAVVTVALFSGTLCADLYTSYTSLLNGSDYDLALSMALTFFGGQRCGDTHNWMLHNNPDTQNSCHTHDAYNGMDMTGGWHDCGDFIKVATTMGYAATCLLVAYDVWPTAFQDRYDNQYGPPDAIPDVLNEVKIATDYFIKSFPDPNTFVYYVGNGDDDHRVWCTSSFQSTLSVENGGDPRPSTASKTAGGPQAAGYAAALALMGRLYPDATYRQQCITAAIRAWEFAKKHTQNISIPSYYPSPNSEYSDEYALAGILLAMATGDNSYKTEGLACLANKWESNAPLAWDTFADITYYYVVLDNPSADNGSGGRFAEFLRKNIESLAYTSGLSHPEGFPFFPSRWGTNKLACGSAFAAALYCDLVEKGKIGLSKEKAAALNRRDFFISALCLLPINESSLRYLVRPLRDR